MLAYRHLPVAPLPKIDFPVISVSGKLPGADPDTVATSLAAPLEKYLGVIPGVNEMTSVSSLGSCSVALQFDINRDIDAASRDVMAAINAASSDLPANLPSPPTYHKSSPADMPVLVIAMSSKTMGSTEVFRYADEIVGQRLCEVPGVSEVGINGSEKSAVRVQVDPAMIASAGLSLEEVRTFLSQVNMDLPKGSLEGEKTSYSIALNDQLFAAKDYRNLIVSQRNGAPILLSSIGRVVDDTQNSRLAGWANRTPAVLLTVFKDPNANVIETVNRIKAEIPRLKTWLPAGITFSVISDRTTTIRASVREVQFSLLFSIALVVLVMMLFLRRFWPTFIASVTVPLALAGTFGAMYLLGYSLDNLSLMALAVSVGFVVDDAIVVIENVVRHVEAGETPLQAALKGARQIGFTILSISLSLVAVFIPLLFMGGLIGRLFHEFSVTLSTSILISAVISLTLTPMLCARRLRPESSYAGGNNRIQEASEAAFNWLLACYRQSLVWVLRRQSLVLILSLLTLGATVWLYDVIPKGLFPLQDTGMISGTVEASQDVSFATMAKLQSQITEIILSDPAVDTIGSFVGGNRSSQNNGRMYITLKPLSERKVKAEEVIARLRGKLVKVQGVAVFLRPHQDIRVGGRMSKAEYQYALQSGSLSLLNTWVPKLVDKLKTIPKLTDVTSDQMTGGLQSSVEIDRDTASRLGLSLAAIDNTLYDAFGQRQVSTMYKRYNQHYVILEVDPSYQQDPSALNKIFVKSSSGQQIPLSAVAKFRTTNTLLSVPHQGQFPAVTISFNLAPGVSLEEATRLVTEAKRQIGMPQEINGSFQGTAQVFQSSLTSMPVLIAAALIAVYIVLGMLYESLLHPLTIISTLPSAGVGALLALMAFGLDLSIVAFIGIILLMGIVKKNAIMMVDFALEAVRSDHLSHEEAIFRACIVRFRPIMMTTLAALFGALPLAVGFGEGSELRQPLGISVMGGLIVSQVITLYTTPVIYLGLERLKERFHKLRLSFRDRILSPA